VEKENKTKHTRVEKRREDEEVVMINIVTSHHITLLFSLWISF